MNFILQFISSFVAFEMNSTWWQDLAVLGIAGFVFYLYGVIERKIRPPKPVKQMIEESIHFPSPW